MSATDGYQLAQINIAKLRAPLDSPVLADFVAQLEPINALGEASPGFVWRLQDESGDATSFRPFPDPEVIVNLTVWSSIEALRAFAYHSAHLGAFKRRLEWFEPEGRQVGLWWVPAGTLPTLDDAATRLAFLARHGPSPFTFSFAKPDGPLRIERSPLDAPDAQALIAALNAELRALYPEPGANFFALDHDEVAAGAGCFLIAHLEGEPVACGAIRCLDDHRAEVKRMYVAPAARGRKLGAAVLTCLETEAQRLGVRRLVLETGIRQHQALGLYHRAGFAPTPCWGAYIGVPTSVCLAKDLRAQPRQARPGERHCQS